MTDKPDPLAALRRLGEKLQKEVESLGLELHTFSIMPNFGEGPHIVQVMLSLTDEDLAALDEGYVEQQKVDQQFKELMREDLKAAEEQKAEDASKSAEELLRRLKEGGDILGDE